MRATALALAPCPADEPLTLDDLFWYVVRTSIRQEKRALDDLKEAGVWSYCPLSREVVWRRGRSRRVERPLLPGYIFVALPREADDRDFARVIALRHIHGFLGVGKPVWAPFRLIKALMDAEEAGAYDRKPDVKAEFKPGDRVKVIAGPYQGFIASFLEAPKKDRMKVLLTVFGRAWPAELPAGQLVALGDI